MENVILASQSPRRKELLHYLVEEFRIMPADIDESVLAGEDPAAYVLRMAQEKGEKIAKDHRKALVIASDTIVVHEGQILGKPQNRENAFKMLQQMSGKTHHVYTGVALQQGEKRRTALTEASVSFYELTEAEINRYLDSGEYADKAGAYGIQGRASVFVKAVQGDYYSIVGFPVGAVNQMLKEF